LSKKGKELVEQHGQPTDIMYGYDTVRDLPPSFMRSNQFSFGVYDTYHQALNDYQHISNGCLPTPYFPPNVPQFNQQIQHNASRQNSDYPQIINHETINCRDHHYYYPTFYNGAGDSTLSDQSWMDSTTSSIFHLQQGSHGMDQNDSDTYQEPPHHSFW